MCIMWAIAMLRKEPLLSPNRFGGQYATKHFLRRRTPRTWTHGAQHEIIKLPSATVKQHGLALPSTQATRQAFAMSHISAHVEHSHVPALR